MILGMQAGPEVECLLAGLIVYSYNRLLACGIDYRVVIGKEDIEGSIAVQTGGNTCVAKLSSQLYILLKLLHGCRRLGLSDLLQDPLIVVESCVVEIPGNGIVLSLIQTGIQRTLQVIILCGSNPIIQRKQKSHSCQIDGPSRIVQGYHVRSGACHRRCGVLADQLVAGKSLNGNGHAGMCLLKGIRCTDNCRVLQAGKGVVHHYHKLSCELCLSSCLGLAGSLLACCLRLTCRLGLGFGLGLGLSLRLGSAAHHTAGKGARRQNCCH